MLRDVKISKTLERRRARLARCKSGEGKRSRKNEQCQRYVACEQINLCKANKEVATVVTSVRLAAINSFLFCFRKNCGCDLLNGI